MDAVVEAVRPVDGTQDAEANRASIKDALSEVLGRFPDADLLNLQDEQRELAIETYVAGDVFRRFELDIGHTITEKAPSASVAASRLREIKDYIRQTVAASFRKLREGGHRMVGGAIAQTVQRALTESFQVFESYAE